MKILKARLYAQNFYARINKYNYALSFQILLAITSWAVLYTLAPLFILFIAFLFHPVIGLFAYLFVVVMSVVFIYGYFSTEGLVNLKEKQEFYFDMTPLLGALIATSFHFAIACWFLQVFSELSFLKSDASEFNSFSWVGYAWYNVAEATLLDFPGIYGVFVSDIKPNTFIAKTMTFFFRLMIDFLYIVTIVSGVRVWLKFFSSDEQRA